MDFKETPNLQMERSIISRKTLSDYGSLVQRLGCYPVTVERRVRFSRGPLNLRQEYLQQINSDNLIDIKSLNRRFKSFTILYSDMNEFVLGLHVGIFLGGLVAALACIAAKKKK